MIAVIIMKLEEKQLKRTPIYEGKVIKVYVDDVELPDGHKSKREIVEHRGGVTIAARKEDGTLIMVNQYRYALNRVMKEFVAGKKEYGEEPLLTAQRELEEESGYVADKWVNMGRFIPTCGYDNEIIDLFYAEGLHFVGQHLDENEFLNVYSMSLSDIIKEIEDGTIQDGKTIILAYKLLAMESK